MRNGFEIPPATTSPQPTTAPPSRELRVMSFNIRYGLANDGDNKWPRRRELLMRTIDAYGAELLGVQEALDFQTDELRQHLRDYDFAGIGREDGKRKGEFAALFYRRDRFELLDSGTFWLSEHLEQAGSVSWDAALTRIASWVKLRDKIAAGDDRDARASNRAILWINMHWDHEGKVARAESARLVRRRIAELRASSTGTQLPVIVTGDLNCHEDDAEYKALVGDAKPQAPASSVRDMRADAGAPTLVDAYREAHPTRRDDEASFHGFKGSTAGSRIDFIFHSREIETLDATIDHTSEAGRFPSDHFPVTARLKLPN